VTSVARVEAVRVAQAAGLLFDLDGTLAITEHLHRAAFNALLGEAEALDPASWARRVKGRSSIDVMASLFPAASEPERKRLIERKEASFRSLAAQHGLVPTPGVRTLLDWTAARDVACALITNAPRANAEAVLAILGIADAFDLIVSAHELDRGKPHPDPYLAGLEALGLDPTRALAVEDSLVGIASARAADLDVIAVLSAVSEPGVADAATIAVSDMGDPRLLDFLAARFGLAR
jgi:HAD superfamily hydrolase (TIGR01509 family)